MSKGNKRKTNITVLDELLGGGIPIPGITTIAGKAGMGKTVLLLTMAAKSKKDVVFYSPKLSYGEIKDHMARICTSLNIKPKDVDYEINTSLWMRIQFKDHRVYVAGNSVRPMESPIAFMNSVTSLVETGAVELVLIDSSHRDGPDATRMNEAQELKMDKELIKLSGRTRVPIVSTVLIPSKTRTEDIDEWLDDHVLEYSEDVVLVDGWPTIKGGYSYLSLSVLTHENGQNKWAARRDALKLKHVVGTRSIRYHE